jgi:hypothetical protein
MVDFDRLLVTTGGYRKVTFRSHEICVKASDGPCGMTVFSDDSSVSIEVQKAIHINVKVRFQSTFSRFWSHFELCSSLA